MSQPSRSLSWATDASYPAGTDPWSSGPTKVALSSGEMAAGFVPDTQVPAEKINDLLNLITGYVESVADAPALIWDRLADTSAQPSGGNAGSSGNINLGATTVGVAPGVLYSNVDAEVLVHINGRHFYFSEDGYTWVDPGVLSPILSNVRGGAIGVRADGTTISILTWGHEASGPVQATNNFGTSWFLAGTLAPSFDGSLSFGGAHPTSGRFFICARSQLYYSDDLANVPWTRIDTASLGWNGAPPPDPKCFETSPTECVIGIAGSPSCIHSTDGITWAASSFGTNPGDGVGAIHWSESHQKWIALSYSNGRILTAPAGFASWTECPQIVDRNGTAYTSLYAVCSLGRTVVVAAGNGLWASRDLQNWRRLPIRLTADGTNPDTWQFIRSFNGRLWAGRLLEVSAANSLEFTLSGVLPAEFSKQGAW